MVTTSKAPGGLTVMDRVWVSTLPRLSVTCAVKGKVPAIVGVPEISPAALRVSPVGRGPVPGVTTDHTLPPLPPVATPAPATPAGAKVKGEPKSPRKAVEAAPGAR